MVAKNENNMKPKEKAKEMVMKFSILLNYDFVTDLRWHDPNSEDRNRRVKKDAKKCALASLDLIVEQNNVWINQTGKGTNNYWTEVKTEINNI
jgi:hypothetical protein